MSRGTELPAALAAFLRGAERRAFTFLWLQGGDAAAAERALAAAIRAFPGPAERMPMAEWPTRFWKLLLALPPEPARGAWPPELAFLAALPVPARRALLLRQVAGLDEETAAGVLATDLPGYQQALAEACPRDASGAPDATGWRRQAEAIQQAGRDLDVRQLQRLAQLRESALAARPPATAPPTGQPTGQPSEPEHAQRPARRGVPARGRTWLMAALVVAGLVLAAWWLHTAGRLPGLQAAAIEDPPRGTDDLRVHDNAPVVIEPLPPAEPPARAPDWPAALPEPVQDPVIADLALLSWYAAGMPPSRIERDADPQAADAAFGGGADVAPAALEAWQHLDAIGQAQVRAAAAALETQDPATRAQLRARFAALDAMERAGWLLGPGLGADYARLQPLVGFVGEGERAPMLAVLRALTPEQRARLGELSARTPPAERQRLRAELLATPPAGRGAWLEQRARE